MSKIYSEKLNKKEIEILQYIEEEISKKGNSPSLREISENTTLKSPTTVSKYLKNIEEKGYIEIVRKKGKISYIQLKREIYKRVEENENNNTRKISKVKISSVPLIGRIYDKENPFSSKNIEEIIGVPVEFAKQENVFAFKNTSNEFKDKGMPRSAIIVVDKKHRLIPGDYVAKYIDGKFSIAKYKRGEKTDIVGKVIGSYIDIKF